MGGFEMNVLEIAITKGLIIEGESTANAIAKVEAFATEIVAQKDARIDNLEKRATNSNSIALLNWKLLSALRNYGNILTIETKVLLDEACATRPLEWLAEHDTQIRRDERKKVLNVAIDFADNSDSASDIWRKLIKLSTEGDKA
jgi:hypothetical protein